MSIDWRKPVELLGINQDQCIIEVFEIYEEEGFVTIDISYEAQNPQTDRAEYYDTICVDFNTGEPLCYYLDKSIFTVKNV